MPVLHKRTSSLGSTVSRNAEPIALPALGQRIDAVRCEADGEMGERLAPWPAQRAARPMSMARQASSGPPPTKRKTVGVSADAHAEVQGEAVGTRGRARRR